MRITSGGLLAATPGPSISRRCSTELLYNKTYSLLYEGGHRWIDARHYGLLNTLPIDRPTGTPPDVVFSTLPIPTRRPFRGSKSSLSRGGKAGPLWRRGDPPSIMCGRSGGAVYIPDGGPPDKSMEDTDMIHRPMPVSHLRLLALLAVLLPLAGCGGGGSKYAGTWKRDLYGEGEVQMNLAANGGVELMLPSPRWPDSVDMKGTAQFKGDTLIFPADSAGSPCQTDRGPLRGEPAEDELHIAGVGLDGCGGRHAALVGAWTEVLAQAGHCCVTQWNAPSPQTRSVQSIADDLAIGKERLQRGRARRRRARGS